MISMGGFWVIFFIQLLSSCFFVASKEQCIAGKYHKKLPSPETATYPECAPWQNKTCCTAAFANELNANQTKGLYNHDWHRCKQLSTKCERFWINQECFYQCSPYVYKWKQTIGNPSFDILKGVPICASVCDRWYQACKSDLICAKNVLTDYNFTENGNNFCPKNKPCITYEQMYGSGEALCQNMWGDSFTYTKENRDSSNCMVMWFSGKNPNQRVKLAIKGSSPQLSSQSSCAVTMLLFLTMLYQFVLL